MAAAVSDARAVATVAILRRHQDSIAVAMLATSHSPEPLSEARALVAELSSARRRPMMPQCPFHQDEATGAVGNAAHTCGDGYEHVPAQTQ